MSGSVTTPEPEASRRPALDRWAYERFLPLIRRAAMRLVRKVPEHITVGDLIGYGWVGLMEAYQRAQPDMPAQEFEAYASYRIRGAMLDYLRTLDPATRDLRRASRKLTDVIRALTGRFNRPPQEEEIAAELETSIDDYHVLLQRISQGGLARLEVLDLDRIDIDNESTPVDEEIARKELGQAVAEAIETLPQKLQQVLALYYQEECTLREIGLVLGVTESRVCQLHSEAMHRLRACIGSR
jgi:RNA polymerase sigma factor for flagellar operon FliA